MREWNLGMGDPLQLTLAADARLSKPDYTNDHIWEMSLGGVEPPALALQTTFGLRAGWLRLFPRFEHSGQVLTDPAAFDRPPRLVRFYPNYLALSFSPFSGIDVFYEVWVPSSQVITGRIRIMNNSILPDTLRLEWTSLLSPLGEGQAMAAVPVGISPALIGSSDNLSPVCVLSGNPQAASSPFPALAVDMELFPGNTRYTTWALAALPQPEDSLELARRTITASWDAEVARIDLQNQQHTLEIFTGDPQWDAALAFAQKSAFSLFFPANQHLPFPSFVHSRNPDQGFSPRGDGSDYPLAWNGQSALASWYLSSLILPGAPELARGLLLNFLHTQEDDGSLDGRPGMAGQRVRYLAQPVLASLALRIEGADCDPTWVREIYPPLLRFLKAWLSPQHDVDGDGFPEWEHIFQTGDEDNPLFDRWKKSSQGTQINTIESPALLAFLYRECNSLIRIARMSGDETDLPWLEEQAGKLRQLAEETWDDSSSTYRFRDYQTHTCLCGQKLKKLSGDGVYPYPYTFPIPQRLIVHVSSQDENTRTAMMTLSGCTPDGIATETLQPRDFLWVHGEGRATSHLVYSSLEQIEIHGLQGQDKVALSTVDITQESISLLLPLWAAIPDPQRANKLIDTTLLDRYLGPHGVSMTPSSSSPDETASIVEMIWNQLLGEGLLTYGRQKEAANLVTRLMETVIASLKEQHKFRQFYDAGTGSPSGDLNSLLGLAPVGLFLQTVGLESMTPQEILLRDTNPFPWPVTIKYRGVKLVFQTGKTVITYPSGQTITVEDVGPYRLSLV